MPPFFRLTIGGRSLRKSAGNGGAAPELPSENAGLFVHRAPAGRLRSSRRRIHNGFTIIIANPAALVNVRCALCFY